MILEYCQLLSTAHRVLDGRESIALSETGRKKKVWKLDGELETKLYSATHINHPSAVWVRQSVNNYVWLTKLLTELCEEYTYRYGKVHKCEQIKLVETLAKNIPKNLTRKEFTEPTPAMPDEVKVVGDSIKSYRAYYINNKNHIASWKGKINSRTTPEWFDASLQIQR
jgi:hypothetical protein